MVLANQLTQRSANEAAILSYMVLEASQLCFHVCLFPGYSSFYLVDVPIPLAPSLNVICLYITQYRNRIKFIGLRTNAVTTSKCI